MARINFLPYEEAKERIQSLNLRSFREYCKLSKQGKLPERIPSAPHDVYKGKGWIDWSDFLGKKRHSKPLPFKGAKKIVENFNIRTKKEYYKLYKQGKLPKGMPRYPANVYENKGWISWYDFLGYKRFDWLSFEDAKKIIQKLEIPNGETFGILHKEGKIPKGIPATPHDVYKNKGWNGWPDFLGNEKNIVYNTTRNFLSFKEARRIVRTLGIKSEKEYRTLGKQGKLPKGLPANPQLVYRRQ